MSKTEAAEKLEQKELAGEMVEVTVTLFKPFVDFLKDYMAFFGVKDTVENLCRRMIYTELEYLHNELSEFAEDESHLIDSETWFSKHSHVANVAFKEDKEEGDP